MATIQRRRRDPATEPTRTAEQENAHEDSRRDGMPEKQPGSPSA